MNSSLWNTPLRRETDWVTKKGIQNPFQILYTVRDEIVPTTLIGQQWKASTCKLWQPTEGEWCVFYNDYYESYVIAKYTKTTGHGSKFAAVMYDTTTRGYDNIAPLEFVQTLENNGA